MTGSWKTTWMKDAAEMAHGTAAAMSEKHGGDFVAVLTLHTDGVLIEFIETDYGIGVQTTVAYEEFEEDMDMAGAIEDMAKQSLDLFLQYKDAA